MARALKPLGSAWPLDEAAAHFAYTLADAARAGLVTWLDLMVQWNARMDLTAARSEDELVDLMLADAVILAQRVPEEARVVDVGTGAGAPGVALAFMRPDLRVTLVEPLTKRVSFLRTALAAAKRDDVVIVRGKGEESAAAAGGAGAPKWDVAVARATLPPPAWLALGTRLVSEGGSVWVLLAKEPAPDGAQAGAGVQVTLEEDVEYTWPRGGAGRRAVRYRVGSGGA